MGLDPFKDAVGELLELLNGYSYANSNPVNRVDPSGMTSQRWLEPVARGWFDWGLHDFFVESEIAQNVRNNPEDAALTVAYSVGTLALIVGTGGIASPLITPFLIGTAAVAGADLFMDLVEGDPLSLSVVPASQIVGGGFMASLGGWFFGGGEFAALVPKGELVLYGTGLVSAQQTFELTVDYIIDGAVNLNTTSSYLANLLLGGTGNLLPREGQTADFLQFLYEMLQNMLVNGLNNGYCPK